MRLSRNQAGSSAFRRILERQNRRAAAAVEFAALAPLLAILALGMLDGGRAFQVKQILNDAARKGCRTAVLPAKTNADVTSEVNNILAAHGIAPGGATIRILVTTTSSSDITTAVPGIDRISVQVSIPLSRVFVAGYTHMLDASSMASDAVVMLKQG